MKTSIKVVLFALTFFSLIHSSYAKKHMTDWMSAPELKAYFEKQKKKYNDRVVPPGHWVSEVDGRYKNGQVEYRYEYAPMPSDCGCGWQWWFNKDEKVFKALEKKYKKEGWDMVHEQSFTLPSGEKRYQGVWHKQP